MEPMGGELWDWLKLCGIALAGSVALVCLIQWWAKRQRP